MLIIESSFKVLDNVNGAEILKKLEVCGRVCYKSEDQITDKSSEKFVEMLIKRGHLSVLEHEKITVKVICDRGISHELVRHRIASYSQESSRYVNHAKKEITFIKPFFFLENTFQFDCWIQQMQYAETAYMELIKAGAKPEQARSILPNSLKTEIVITMNLRSWRHFFALRTHKTAHSQMREITIPMLAEFRKLVPIIFENLDMYE